MPLRRIRDTVTNEVIATFEAPENASPEELQRLAALALAQRQEPLSAMTLPVPTAPFQARAIAQAQGGTMRGTLGTIAPAVGAAALRLIPGALLANPALVGLLSAGGEAAAQQLEGESVDPWAIGTAGALPIAASTAVRGARALGRTATRFVPSLFESAQARALSAAERAASRLEPETAATQFFESARRAGTEVVSMGPLSRALDDVGRSVRAAPASPQQKALRELINGLRTELDAGNGALSLDALDAVRRDVAGSIGRAGPGAERLYRGVIESLEEAAQAGGQGAGSLRAALQAFKQELGAEKWRQMVTESQFRRPGEPTLEGLGLLNMGKLTNRFHAPKTHAEMAKLLGPERMAIIEEFLRRYQSLPPTMATTTFASLVGRIVAPAGLGALIGSQAGGALPGAIAGLAGAFGPDFVQNFAAVGRNPQALTAVMNVLALGAHAALREEALFGP